VIGDEADDEKRAEVTEMKGGLDQSRFARVERPGGLRQRQDG
jgi:hypothetical protein